MISTRFTIFSIFTMILFSNFALSADNNNKYSLSGVGIRSCNQYINAISSNKDQLRAFADWIEGYISAYNRFNKATFDAVPITDRVGILTFVRNVCKNNRKMSVANALNGTLIALNPYRLQKESKLIIAQNGKHRATVRQETLARAQLELQKRGLYKSTIDGLYGNNTRDAFLKYQKSAGIPQSGVPDALTLMPLLFNNIAKSSR